MGEERLSYSYLKEKDLLQVVPRIDMDDLLGIEKERNLYDIFNEVAATYLVLLEKNLSGDFLEVDEEKMSEMEAFMIDTWRSAVEDENEEVRVFVEEVMDGSYGDWKDNLNEEDQKLLKDSFGE